MSKNSVVMTAAVVVTSVVIAPLVAMVFKSVVPLLILPAVVSVVVAFMYKGYVGEDMSYNFRRETTTLVAVLGVILVAILSVKYPAETGQVFDGVQASVEPIFMLLYRSLMVIVGTAVAVFLPLSLTVKK